MPTKLSHVGEFGLIDLIKKNVCVSKDVFCGMGDDTAVLKYSAKEWMLFTTDMLTEGVHFTKRMSSKNIGRKALACSISDIAAMGGLPTYAVISFGAPSRINAEYALGIFKGINKLAKQFGVNIVGGDTVKNEKTVINVALLGKVKKNELVLRSGAKKGDIIFTTGPLGRSLKTGKHFSFIPRIKESQFLVKKLKPSSMIDISDGLVADLGHVLEESHVGAILDTKSIPKNPRATLKDALYDGEDFELLFTLSHLKAKRLKKMRCNPFVFHEIGKIVEERSRLGLCGVTGRKLTIKQKGYEHF